MAAGDLTSQLTLANLASGQQNDPILMAALPRMQIAQAMMQQGLSDAPTGKWGALSRVAQSLLGNVMFDKATTGLQEAYGNAGTAMAQALPRGPNGEMHPMVAALVSGDPATRAAAMKAFPGVLAQISAPEFARPGTTPYAGVTKFGGPQGGYSPSGQLVADQNANPAMAPTAAAIEQQFAAAKAQGALPANMTQDQFKAALDAWRASQGPIAQTPQGTSTIGRGAPIPGVPPGMSPFPAVPQPPGTFPTSPQHPNNMPLAPLHVPGTPPGNAGPLTAPPAQMPLGAQMPTVPPTGIAPAPPSPSLARPEGMTPPLTPQMPDRRSETTGVADPNAMVPAARLEMQKAQHAKDAEVVQKDAEKAAAGVPTLGTTATIRSMLPSVTTGTGADARLLTAQWGAALGISPENMQKIVGTNPVMGELLQKKLFELSTGAVRSMGAREPGSVISMFQRNYPNMNSRDLTIDAMTRLLDMDQIRNQDYASGKHAFLNESVNGITADKGYRGLSGFDAQFDQVNNPRVYQAAALAAGKMPYAVWSKGLSETDQSKALQLAAQHWNDAGAFGPGPGGKDVWHTMGGH